MMPRQERISAKCIVAALLATMALFGTGRADDIRQTASYSWFDAAGGMIAVALDPPAEAHRTGFQDDRPSQVQEKIEETVAVFDKAGAGELARQCLDATRIVEMSERPGGVPEAVYLLIVLSAAFAALFATRMLAKLFHVEIAVLLWIPMAACAAGIGAVLAALRISLRHRKVLAAGVLASVAGVSMGVGVVRRTVIDGVASVILHGAVWYVLIASVLVPLLGLLFVWNLLGKHAGGGLGSIASFVFRNALGFVAIPLVWAFVFIMIMESASPWFDGKFAGTSASAFAPGISSADGAENARPFSALPEPLRRAVLGLAESSRSAYGNRRPRETEPLSGWTPPLGFSFDGRTGLAETASGTAALVFLRGTDSGGEIVVAFRGTASLRDGKTDLDQLAGSIPPSAYREAANLVEAVAATGMRVVVTGHSLGAGLAQYAVAMNTASGRVRGVGFNPAGLSESTLSDIERSTCGGTFATSRSFVTVRTGNDPVSPVGTLLGPVYLLKGRSGFGLFRNGHSIDSVVSSIKDSLK